MTSKKFPTKNTRPGVFFYPLLKPAKSGFFLALSEVEESRV